MNTTKFTNTTRMSPGFGLRLDPPGNAAKPQPSAPSPQGRTAFDDALWGRLEAMKMDQPGVEMPISRRLRAEHKWTASETNRAIEEYKRFVYLTQRAGFEVTPSRPVDLVWHEHLMHTKHYWDTMCGEVLQKPLHHLPGTGGVADGDRLLDQYHRTIDAYRDAFREDPPANIWPAPKPPASPTRYGYLIAGLGIAIVAGISYRIWPLVIVAGFAIFATIVSAANANQSRKQSQDRGGCGSGCGGGGIGSTGCGDSSGGSSDGGGGDGGGGCGGGGD